MQGTQIVQHLDMASSYFLLNLCYRNKIIPTLLLKLLDTVRRLGLNFRNIRHPQYLQNMIICTVFYFISRHSKQFILETLRTKKHALLNTANCHTLLPCISSVTFNILATLITHTDYQHYEHSLHTQFTVSKT